MHVLHLINDVTPTSISLEIAEHVASSTPVEVSLVAFYDTPTTVQNTDVTTSLEITCLGASSRFDFGAYSDLRRIGKMRGVDVLHTHHNSVGSFARLAFTGTDVKIVNTEHRSHEALSPLQLLTNIASYPQIDTMVFNSEHTRDSVKWFEQTVLRGTKLETVYNGVDVEKIAAHVDCSSGDEFRGPVVTNVARMVDVKNQQRLIRAFATVKNVHSESTLLMIGDGPLKPELESVAAEVGIEDSVQFVGEVSRERVYQLLGETTVFVMPSISEGFCVAAVEAMAAGLPIVASDIDVLREVIGDAGVFVNPQNEYMLGDAIRQLLEDENNRTTLAERARQRAISKFPIEKAAEAYYDIYCTFD